MNKTSSQSLAEIEERVKGIAAALAGKPAAEVSGDSMFEADLGFDSLDRVEFIMKLEEEFEISVPDETAEGVRTVGQAVPMPNRPRSAAKPGRKFVHAC